jgi:hypothetical protein
LHCPTSLDSPRQSSPRILSGIIRVSPEKRNFPISPSTHHDPVSCCHSPAHQCLPALQLPLSWISHVSQCPCGLQPASKTRNTSRKGRQGVCLRGILASSLLVYWGHDKFPIQVAASNLRFGDGVTREVGMDLKNMKATKVGSAFIDVVQY